MANPVFSPPVEPAIGSTPNNEVLLLSAAFGDGYEQVAPDGLNHVREAWSLRWPSLSQTDANTIVDFLAARGGYEVFDWTPPEQASAKTYRCPQWSPAQLGEGNRYSVTATFRQAFDVG